jgi:hypothetical protein
MSPSAAIIKPNSFQNIYVRPEGHTLRKNKIFRSLGSPALWPVRIIQRVPEG